MSTGRSHPVRRRFTVVIVGVVAAALLVTGLGTLLLLARQARQNSRHDLIQLASNMAQVASVVPVTRVTALRAFLRRTQDIAILSIPRQSADRLPRGITAADLRVDLLAAGQTVSGFDGNVAYGIVPFTAPNGARFAVAVSQPTSGNGGAGLYFLSSAAVALLVAAAAAEALTRRITRPLVEAEEATRRIAAGDLSVRLTRPARSSNELSSLIESINTMAVSLERLRGGERQFLMSVSHDLRTPLTSIRGFAEALADGTTTDTARAADIIAAEARRLERLVADLLDLAKLEADRFSLDLRAVDVAEVVEDTADGFVPAADRHGLTLVVHDPVAMGAPAGAGGLPLAAADPDRLAQVVANLVENAMKYATATIEVATWFRLDSAGPATVQITVDDDGPGIAADDLPRVFERLWTGGGDIGGGGNALGGAGHGGDGHGGGGTLGGGDHGGGGHGGGGTIGGGDQGGSAIGGGRARAIGSGLGLAIVAELVAAMGGSIVAESPVPRPPGHRGVASPGTRVALTLRTWSAT